MSNVLYLCGPMRGHKNYNFAKFQRAASDLVDVGWRCIVPHNFDHLYRGEQSTARYMEHDIPMIVQECVVGLALADVAHIDKSEGARIEIAVAKAIGKPVRPVADWLETTPEKFNSILLEAEKIVNGPRRQDYGHPREDFTRAASLMSAYFGWDVRAEDIPFILICVKLARERHCHKRDNLTDLCGYAETRNLLDY
jgi:hypothetical protein